MVVMVVLSGSLFHCIYIPRIALGYLYPQRALFTFVTHVPFVPEFECIFHEMSRRSTPSSRFFTTGDDRFARWYQFAKNDLINVRAIPDPPIGMTQTVQ